MTTGLQPTQERSRTRRDALLRAAMELISEGGTRAVTHRAVAARAGLPAASTTYYFESIGQLTNEALRLHVTDRVTELEAMADIAAQGGRSVEDVASRFAEALSARSGNVIVGQYEVYLEAARNPELRPAVTEALDAFESLAAAALAALGARRPEQAAVAFVALIDGFALHRIARHRSAQADRVMLFDAMRDLFVAQMMDEEALSAMYGALREPLGLTS